MLGSALCKPDGDNMASSEKEVEREISRRKKTSKQRAANRKICQYSGMPEASQIKRPWNHQTKMSGIQKCQKDKRLPRDHAVDGRANQAVSGCSYWLSLVCIGSSPSRNFRHPACPGSTCICNAQMMQIHWFWSACWSILRMCFDDNSDSGG